MDFHAIGHGWFSATIDGRQWYGRSFTAIILLAFQANSEYFVERTAPARSQFDEPSHHAPETPLP